MRRSTTRLLDRNRRSELDLEPELDLDPEFDLDPISTSSLSTTISICRTDLDDCRPIAAMAPARDAAPEVGCRRRAGRSRHGFQRRLRRSLAPDDADAVTTRRPPPSGRKPAYHAAEPAAAAADPLDLSLEEELNAMLDDAHAEPEAAIARDLCAGSQSRGQRRPRSTCAGLPWRQTRKKRRTPASRTGVRLSPAVHRSGNRRPSREFQGDPGVHTCAEDRVGARSREDRSRRSARRDGERGPSGRSRLRQRLPV